MRIIEEKYGNKLSLLLAFNEEGRADNNRLEALESEHNDLKARLAYIEAMPEDTRRTFVDHVMFFEKFRKRQVRIEKPYTQFRRDEDPVVVLQRYSQQRYGLFADKINDFFASQTVERLLEQYTEAAKLKKVVEVRE